MPEMAGRRYGKYIVIEQIGSGGHSSVFKAYDPAFDRFVALKVLTSRTPSQDAAFRQRFKQEARAIAMLEHPNIVPVHSFGEENGESYLTMRLVTSGSLEDRISKDKMEYIDAADLLLQVAAALDYAHKHGVLHRDVKPANVLLDEEDNAYLADFGIAKLVETSMKLTGGGLVGTPAYLSPEQCMGDELDGRSDQYSLGVVLYQMITGVVPFTAENSMKIIQMHVLKSPQPPRELDEELPQAAEKVMLKVLSKNPKDRFANCVDFAEQFKKSLAGSGLRINESERMPQALRKRIDAALDGLGDDEKKKK